MEQDCLRCCSVIYANKRPCSAHCSQLSCGYLWEMLLMLAFYPKESHVDQRFLPLCNNQGPVFHLNLRWIIINSLNENERAKWLTVHFHQTVNSLNIRTFLWFRKSRRLIIEWFVWFFKLNFSMDIFQICIWSDKWSWSIFSESFFSSIQSSTLK